MNHWQSRRHPTTDEEICATTERGATNNPPMAAPRVAPARLVASVPCEIVDWPRGRGHKEVPPFELAEAIGQSPYGRWPSPRLLRGRNPMPGGLARVPSRARERLPLHGSRMRQARPRPSHRLTGVTRRFQPAVVLIDGVVLAPIMFVFVIYPRMATPVIGGPG